MQYACALALFREGDRNRTLLDQPDRAASAASWLPGEHNQYLRGTTSAEWYSRMGAFPFIDASFTDVCVPAVTRPSVGSQDGWILELTETNSTGGSLNSNATTIGHTSPLPY